MSPANGSHERPASEAVDRRGALRSEQSCPASALSGRCSVLLPAGVDAGSGRTRGVSACAHLLGHEDGGVRGRVTVATACCEPSPRALSLTALATFSLLRLCSVLFTPVHRPFEINCRIYLKFLRSDPVRLRAPKETRKKSQYFLPQFGVSKSFTTKRLRCSPGFPFVLCWPQPGSPFSLL